MKRLYLRLIATAALLAAFASEAPSQTTSRQVDLAVRIGSTQPGQRVVAVQVRNLGGLRNPTSERLIVSVRSPVMPAPPPAILRPVPPLAAGASAIIAVPTRPLRSGDVITARVTPGVRETNLGNNTAIRRVR